jgi:zinc transport system permease protein
MAIISSIIGVCSVVIGLQTSMIWNTSTGPTILVITLGVFIITLLPLKKLLISKKKIELSDKR